MHFISCIRVAGIAAMFAAAAIAWAAAESPSLKIIQTTEANFPPALLADGITSGHVKAALHIDANGRLVDHLILAFTHRALAAELAEALPEWQFEIPRERGEPTGIRTVLVFSFEAKGSVLSLTATNTAMAYSRWIPEPEISVFCEPTALDRPLQAVRTAAPFHPGPRLQPRQGKGTATIDFYVDTNGHPRMPVVVAASHDAFGDAAVQAVSQWRFAPPTHAGKPALVRVRQQFVFSDNT